MCKLLCSPEMVLPTKGDDKELKEIIYQNNLEHCQVRAASADITHCTDQGFNLLLVLLDCFLNNTNYKSVGFSEKS